MHPTPERVLAIYAHPDDPEVSSGGTLARWAGAGSEIHLLICSQGEKGSRDASVLPDDLRARRIAEVGCAAKVIGVATHELLGYPDGELENTVELRAQLVERIRRIRPDVVMGPDPTAVFFGSGYVNHHDHRSLGFAVLDACAPAASSPLYFREAGPPHQVSAIYLSGSLEPDTAIDIGETLDQKVRALACHESQLGEDVELIAELLGERARESGRKAGIEHAEEFRVIRLAG